LNGLQKYQHFLFEAANPGVVKTQTVANGSFTELEVGTGESKPVN
jgi:hypothetical protein